MDGWLGVRLGEQVRYIALHHIIDVTFIMAAPEAVGADAVLAATLRIAVPGRKLETITSSGAGARDLYRQVVGERG
jgi:hypothetical protein